LAQADEEKVFNCAMGRATTSDELAMQMTFLAALIARDAQSRGALLLHGALAERDGQGVILAAPGGTGKSTASRRFLAPWRSLSDDATLVVCDAHGRYFAHPWPTWSRFFPGGVGGSWSVWQAAPLRAAFFLAQAPHERVERLGSGQACCLLTESSEQVSQLMALDQSEEGLRRLRRERFQNASAMARVIPCYSLELSLHGKFWETIESVL
jgi:SynChlorMet cassette protein ScmC